MSAKETVLKILQQDSVGVLSTVRDGKPFSRYMTFTAEDVILYTPTSKETEKVDELERNSNVHLLLGYDGEGFGDAYVEYAGTATVSEDVSLKKKIWNEHMKPWFTGPDDPNLVILEIKPTAIRLMNKKGQPPQEISI